MGSLTGQEGRAGPGCGCSCSDYRQGSAAQGRAGMGPPPGATRVRAHQWQGWASEAQPVSTHWAMYLVRVCFISKNYLN